MDVLTVAGRCGWAAPAKHEQVISEAVLGVHHPDFGPAVGVVRDRALALDAVDEDHLRRLDTVREDRLDGHDRELVHVLLAGVEEVEGEVVALEDGAELVLLPVLVSHHHAVRVARPLVPHLQRDVERPARIVRPVGRGQLLQEQQLGAALGLLGGGST